ncbi:sodium/calcium exchanger membrane protein [Sphingopyxis fribergensis]|uniref:Sodium/calcium exchanger membrane protein n=1 Tax=Sphingopyxis fribergensis TaxID=1515612 RepID=A0A0A7PBQ7_9SPHN|nr:ionic transporter y4hA [Sphingopyxis fribergensis]AJA07374.1 sodium/calcium exchanger membrane protein [Sphingopyxis fribergensis]
MTSRLRIADRTHDLFPVLGFLAAMASLAMPLNPWLVAFILMGAIIAAVHHAEVIAHRVGEPFGTLILALAVTVIEVGLILTLMQAEPEKAQTLARDTVFAAVMVILNLLMGLCLLSGAIRHHEQRFQRTGIGAALATLTVLTVVTLVLPNYTSSAPGSFYSATQLAFVALVSLILYATFALVQTVRHRDYFLPDEDVDADGDGEPDNHAAPPTVQRTAISGALLLASLFAVVLLAKNLSPVMGALLSDWGAPPAVLGVLIAALILAPEGLAAVRAAKADRLQTSLNLALGSALATIGLTIPAVAILSIMTDMPISLGLDAKSTVLLFLSLIVSVQTLANGRTTVLQGVIHLMLFAIYLFTTFVP